MTDTAQSKTPDPPDTFLVYQMGKVGSKTISRALTERFGKTLHTHDHKRARLRLDRQPQSHVFTGVREPLARFVSAFFQNIDQPDQHWYVGPQSDILAMETAALHEIFWSRLDRPLERNIAPWYDRFADTTGLDVADIGFDPDQGYAFVGHGGRRYYIYTLERFDAFLGALRQVAPFEEMAFPARNRSGDKWYRPVPARFLADLRAPQRQMDAIFAMPWVRVFYSPAQIEAFMARYAVVNR